MIMMLSANESSRITPNNQLYTASNFFDNLHNVFVMQDMVTTHFLRPMLNTGAPHKRIFELLHDGLVDAIAEVLYTRMCLWQHNRLVVIGQLPLQDAFLFLSLSNGHQKAAKVDELAAMSVAGILEPCKPSQQRTKK